MIGKKRGVMAHGSGVSKGILFLLFFLTPHPSPLTPSLLWADVNLSLRLDKNQAGAGEPVTLEIAVTGSIGSLGEPKIAIPHQLSVLSQSKSQKIEVLNWKMTTSIVYTLILSGSQPGAYKIGPASLDTGAGQVATSDAVNLQIVDQKTNQNPGSAFPVPIARHKFPRTAEDMIRDKQSPQSGGQPQGAAQAQETAPGQPAASEPPLVFVEARTDKNEAFVGEPVKFSVLFYTRVPFPSQPQYTPPSLSGFWSEDLVQKTYTAVARGHNYQVTEIPVILFPTVAGKLSIGAAKVQIELANAAGDPFSMDPFDPQFLQRFLGMGGGDTRVLQTKPLTVTAKNLPEEGRPGNFSGAVGRYSIAAQLDKKDIKVGESLTLTVTISGEGNIRGLPSPIYPNLEGIFRSYETEKSETISKNKEIISGQKIFKLLLIPQVPGRPTLAVGPARFIYFDPDAKQYKELKTPPLEVKVSGEAIQQVASSQQETAQAKKMADDIGYIVEESPKTSAVRLAAALISKSWPVTAAFPIFLGLLTAAFRTIEKKRAVFKKKPMERLAAALRQAERLNREGKSRQAVTLMGSSLETALSLLLDIAVSKLTARVVMDKISQKWGASVSAQELEILGKALENVQFARFAPMNEEEATAMFAEISKEILETKRILDRLVPGEKHYF
ncbi:MAG: protein BatD [Elusimicrobia bacterium]|nr:protein BatD [Elusimicrobiota bacterium]